MPVDLSVNRLCGENGIPWKLSIYGSLTYHFGLSMWSCCGFGSECPEEKKSQSSPLDKLVKQEMMKAGYMCPARDSGLTTIAHCTEHRWNPSNLPKRVKGCLLILHHTRTETQ